jgi:glutathione synthase/RimK-type ligase-like ATP-grasp enzyme
MHLWTVTYNYPDVPINEVFDHAELGTSARDFGFQHSAINLFKLRINPKLRYDGSLIERPNMVFLRAMIIRDEIYNDLKSLETSGVVFLNDIDAHYNASNKINIFKILENSGIPIPKTLYLNIPFIDEDIDRIEDEIGWPCVTKWMHGYAKIGVDICHTPYDLYRIAKNRKDIALAHRLPESKFNTLIIQKLISVKHVVQVHSIGDIHHAVMQFHPYEQGFKSNLQKGLMTLPHKIDDDIRKISSDVIRCLKLDTVRIEMLLDKDGYKVCEINPQASYGWVTMVHLKNISDILVKHLYNKTIQLG